MRSEHRRAIAFAAGDIQDHLTGRNSRRLQVSMDMFELNQAVSTWHKPFTGKFHPSYLPMLPATIMSHPVDVGL
jgi:hypothetical protein